MIDYSFLRLKPNLSEALNINDSPVTTHFYFSPIQLLPNKTYTQITNVEGGISFSSDVEVFVVDCSDKILADITNNVFFREFIDVNGNNQLVFELVNLGVDFYRTTVLIKIKQLASDAVYYTNPINITAFQSEKTVFFKYKNYDDFLGIGYTNANAWQSISLSMYFDFPIDETEVEDYFQISRNTTISARALIKLFEQYHIEKINRFTYDRLNALLKHELIYLDNIRVTNKPTVKSNEREGDSNFMVTDMIVAKNYKDVSFYDFQVFQGLKIINITPIGNVTQCTVENDAIITYSVPITLENGTITIFDASDNSLVRTFTQEEMSVSGNNLIISDFFVPQLPIGNYYLNISQGLVSALGFESQAVFDNTTWFLIISEGDYSAIDYSTDYSQTC